MVANDNHKVLFMSTFPPRECGIATFCQDLYNALLAQYEGPFSFEVCALQEGVQAPGIYPNHVTYRLDTEDIDAYLELAQTLNRDDAIEAIIIQHEFGLFGGAYGSDLLTFLFSIEKPISIVFHTVLPEPNPFLKMVVERIADLVTSIVVMTHTSAELLKRDYVLDSSKIKVIPHGTHLISWGDQKELKEKYGLADRTVLSTFGLISSNKSIETGLKAMPKIIDEFPKVIYLIMGRTHPKVIESEGEQYRESLIRLVEELNIGDHVRFVNEYLSLPILLEYLKLSDLYLFTSKDPNQAVSGTFSYAMSCACPVISTPIPHAKEVLQGNTGLLFEIFDSEGLAIQAKTLLRQPSVMKEMALNAYHQSQHTIWPNVSVAFMNELLKITRMIGSSEYKMPAINFIHLRRMTTSIGVIQFSKISVPDLDSGYTIDDNARALVATIMQYRVEPTNELLKGIKTYLDFLIFCQQEDNTFMNYVDKDGQFHVQNHYVNLEDSNARAIWAIGYLLAHSSDLPQPMVKKAYTCFQRTMPTFSVVTSPRSMAFIIKGLHSAYQHEPNRVYKELLTELANKLVSRYQVATEEGWNWFEDYLTYANGVLPESLILAHELTKSKIYRNVALNSVNFLLSQTFTQDQIKVISNRGWKHKGEKNANRFGEQPIDVAYTILALSSFYDVLKIERYKDYMKVAYSWFLGNNHLQQIMYDPLSGGGNDGLEETNPNLNQGAESTICYLLASMVLKKHCAENPIILPDQTLPVSALKPVSIS